MKSLVIQTILLAFFISASAQETEVIYSEKEDKRPMKTLFKDDKGFGGHLSLNVKGTEFYDETAMLLGGELVFTLSHALNIGIAGYGMPSRIDYRDTDNLYLNPLYVEMGYGGLFIEPVFFDQEVVHLTVPVLIGAGWAGLTDARFFDQPNYNYPLRITDESAFFVFEPGINMEVNLVRYVKLTLGGSYRMINGSSIEGLSDNDMSGFTFGGGIRIGWF